MWHQQSAVLLNDQSGETLILASDSEKYSVGLFFDIENKINTYALFHALCDDSNEDVDLGLYL